MAGLADAAVDQRRFDIDEDVAKGLDQCRVEHVAVALTGQLGKTIDQLRHGKAPAFGSSDSSHRQAGPRARYASTFADV
ncbi:MAG TPA: hypothetical protein VIM34_06390 [Burkholderiaceae bacterium]